MHVFFAAKESYLPDVLDGGCLDVHHTALALEAQGHRVTVIAAHMRERRHPVYRIRQKLAPNRVLTASDTVNGYLTTKVLYWQVSRLLEQQIQSERPELVIVLGVEAEDLAQVAVKYGIPVVIRLVTARRAEELASAARSRKAVAELLASPLVKVVSNSTFLAAYLQDILGLASEVDYPLIDLQDSVVSDRDPLYISFVDPRRDKGLDTVLTVAALLPHHRFVFAESRLLSNQERKDLNRELAQLPNVSFRPCSPNLRSLYEKTAILLAPSLIKEAFGRVIIEACANGIPVIANGIGGIPEAMGDSGVLLAPSDSPERWAEVIEDILSNPDRNSQLSKSAIVNSERKEFQATAVLAQFLEMAKRHATQRQSL